jgi:uncharacterized protein YbgA (DUF1722 family)/uncharacterized protein YbbK (DUF523 family)
MSETIRLGISSCLLGEKVRYDGGHKLDRFLRDTLGRCVEFVPVCPEVECGLSVPRESMRLVGDPDAPRLVTFKTKQDLTDRLSAWAKRRVKQLEKEDLCGFVFKSDSPSSGLCRIKVYTDEGRPPVRKGTGVFARIFTEHFPRLPVEDEGRLHDPGIRENFIERIFALRRWRSLLERGKSRGGLVEFHTSHKLLILSHSPGHYRDLGALVAHAKEKTPAALFDAYERLFLEALAVRSTPKKNTNVLMHMAGYFRRHLSAGEKQELLEVIDGYRRELFPLIVPVTLINHYVRKYGEPYLSRQVFLNPHPVELQLRNHV